MHRTALAPAPALAAALALAAAPAAADTLAVTAARMVDVLTGRVVPNPRVVITDGRIVADERNTRSGKPNPASSILKLKGSELQQATTELLMDVVGPYILPYDDHEDGSNEPPVGPEYAAEAAPTYFNWRKISIYGGSNEIQRNILSKNVLGLPG